MDKNTEIVVTGIDRALIGLSGRDEDEICDQWARWAQVRVPMRYDGAATELGGMLNALCSLEESLRNGELPADSHGAIEAVEYVRAFLSQWSSTPVSAFSAIPMARSLGTKVAIVSLTSGMVRTEMRVQEVTEYGEEKYGELLEVVARNVSNGIMVVGEWKFERGRMICEILDGMGSIAVWEDREKKGEVDGE